jgi:hypothetical protein
MLSDQRPPTDREPPGTVQVTDQPPGASDEGPFTIDLRVARLARLENFLAGGDAHFTVDRAAAEALSEETLSGLEGLRATIEALWAFVARAVGFLAAEAGARQFLQIGTSVPTSGMTHEVARQIAPDARVVYVSYDPTTLAHAHRLEAGAPEEGAVASVFCSYDDPRTILREAAATLDLGRPVVVILPTTLVLIPDDDVARRIVNDLRDAIVSGSHLVLAHTSLDIASERTAKLLARLDQALDEPYVTRTETEILELLDGFELLSPGLVPIEHWRNDDAPPVLGPDRTVPLYGAVGRKP